jgi:hypothetical protein
MSSAGAFWSRVAFPMNFPDAPLRGVFGRNDVYFQVEGWNSFEPWLSRIETLPEQSILSLADELPPEWYGSDSEPLQQLLANLVNCRSLVRELVLQFKNSSRRPFPAWSADVN